MRKSLVRLKMIWLSVLVLCCVGLMDAQLVPNLGGQRAGISAFQFLKIGAGARGVALGESFTAIANDVSALYWNPAGLTQFGDNQAVFAHTEYVVDIKHEFAGVAYHVTSTDVVGVSLTSLHMDDMEITTETQPKGTGRYFSFGDVALGLSYGRTMTDQFSFGLTVKYVEETLDILKMRGVLVDIGTYYWTGIGSTRFAVVVSNFGADVAPKGEVTLYNDSTVTSFQSFSPPTQFKFGIAWDPIEMEGQKITTSLELNHPNDNSENVRLGVEYNWNQWLSLRAGVKRTIGEPLLGRDKTSANDVTVGFGVTAPSTLASLTFDYAFANFNELGSVHRISLRVGF
ncbi:MAG: PorV/PorQ family protein [Ignavibacteriae bacterium]|nr:PorV/PorQ family protein [Ignavibacteriota bacterium]